jgi:hypothetical protein
MEQRWEKSGEWEGEAKTFFVCLISVVFVDYETVYKIIIRESREKRSTM